MALICKSAIERNLFRYRKTCSPHNHSFNSDPQIYISLKQKDHFKLIEMPHSATVSGGVNNLFQTE